MYAQAQDDNAASRRRRRRKKKNSSKSSARTPVDARHRFAAGDSESSSGSSDSSDGGGGSLSSSSSSSSSSLSSSDDDNDRNFDAMDAGSLSYRDGASGGLLARSRRAQQREKKARKKKKRDGSKRLAAGAAGEENSEESSSGEDDDDAEARRMSRKMADTYITESMSVTPGSSVAVGSLMGTSLGQAMSSSFADDGMVWAAAAGAGGMAGTPDDAFFHENVSPCASPPLESSSALGRRSMMTPALDIRGRSDRALF